jgi:sulfocyanin
MTTAWYVAHPGLRRTTLAALWGTLIVMVCGVARPDPDFMRYDADAREVQLSVTAGYDKSHSGFNLNGGFRGSHRITIPAGWRVRIAFVNADVIPHSVGVVRAQKYVPASTQNPAFVGAASRAWESGLPAGARQDDITFTAATPGAYWLACGVPGHAVVGSYLRFVVSADATVPTYETGIVAEGALPRR